MIQHREYLAAQVVSGIGGIGVGGILDPAKPLCIGLREQLRPPDRQQGPGQPPLPQGACCRHGRQPAQSGTAQQTKEQGLGLVLAVLTCEQHLPSPEHLRECGIAGIPGRLFQAGTGRDLNMDDLELETQPITDRLAMLRPIISSGLQAMMDMDDAQ